jgi:hypothetical protein
MVGIDEVEDFKIDSNYDIFISHRGDLATVSGREAFEQKLAIRIEESFGSVINELDKENVKDMLLLEAKRVAEDMDEIENIAAFSATFSEENANTVEVTLVYDSGDELTFEVTE